MAALAQHLIDQYALVHPAGLSREKRARSVDYRAMSGNTPKSGASRE